MRINKTIKIESDQVGKRLDKFLAVFCPEKSRAKWQKAIKEGEALVGHKPILKANYILKAGDSVEILKVEKKKEKKKIQEIKILYEDHNVIVLDKPAGVLSQSAKSSRSPSVTDFLLEHCPEIEEVGKEEGRCGVAHRLDKDTSGIIIAAKNDKSLRFLKNQFKERSARKTYLAFVYGKVDPAEGAIDLKIGRSKSKPDMQTVIDSKKKEEIKSREALTYYETVKNMGNYTLLRISPKTGRMHQIRVHLKAIGYPIVGDKKYFFRKYSKLEPKLERQFLHAFSLEIELPKKGRKEFSSDLPQDLKLFLDKIRMLETERKLNRDKTI